MSVAVEFTGGASSPGAEAAGLGPEGVVYGVQDDLETKLTCLAVDPVASEFS